MCGPRGHTESQEIQMRGNCDDIITTQPLSSSTVSQPAVDINLPEVDSTTEQFTRDSQSESTCCDCLSDCCDACGRCYDSQEMRCFCEVRPNKIEY